MSKMIKCKSCSKEISSNAKLCPGCGAKNKKAIYKRPWFIIVILLIAIGAISSSGDDSTTVSNKNTPEIEIESTEEIEKDTSIEKDIKDDSGISKEFQSALKKAKSYSDTMNMSKAGIYDQLTSEYGEKFTPEAAQYAIDNVEADWNKNALKKAETYQESMAMSPSAIYDQLISEHGEKFTPEEAQYAIDNLS